MLLSLLRLFRPSSRQFVPMFFNIAGLALGLATCATLALMVRVELRFNATLPGADHVWRLDEHWAEPGTQAYESGWASFRAADLLHAMDPDIEAMTHVVRHSVTIGEGAARTKIGIDFTDAAYLTVFPLSFLRGVRDTALATPDSITLSARAAYARFATLDVLGRVMDVTDDAGQTTAYRITGVYADLGPATDPAPDYLARMTPRMLAGSAFKRWGSSSGRTYLRLPDRAAAGRLARALPGFIARYGADPHALGSDLGYYRLSLVSLADAHFHDLGVEDVHDGADWRVVVSLGVIGVLALAIAMLNYVNLATAMAETRARDIAMRKVLGATRVRLAFDVIMESVMTAWIAACLALALCEWAIPVAANLAQSPMRAEYGVLLPVLFGLATFGGISAGIYPALVLSRFNPAAVLAAQRMPGGGRRSARLRAVLVGVQFALAVTIGACTLVVNAQGRFLQVADRGYVRQGLLALPEMEAATDLPREQTLLAAIRAVPGVVGVTLSDQAPGSQAPMITEVNRPGQTAYVMLLNEMVGRDYARTYGMRLLAGRWFDPQYATDRGVARVGAPISGERATVLNLSAVRALGFAGPQDAVGQILHHGKNVLRVIGVAGDMRFTSARAQIKPQFYLATDDPIQDARPVLRFAGVSEAMMRVRVAAVLRTILPERVAVIRTPDQLLADEYAPEQAQGRLFALGALIAIGIACFGLYSVTRFAVMRRHHEIGVRKVLGASSGRVLRLLLWQTMQPVLVASLIACPLAWGMMRGWLAGFDQRIVLSPFYFAGAVFVAVLVSLVTIALQTMRAARTTPAWALHQG